MDSWDRLLLWYYVASALGMVGLIGWFWPHEPLELSRDALRTLDVSHLPPYDISNQSPLFWGQALMALIEGVLFLMLIATYFFLRLGVDVWPAPGVQIPIVFCQQSRCCPCSPAALVLISPVKPRKKEEQSGMLFGLSINLGLAAIFVFLRAMEWRTFNFTWASDAHGSIVWAILFLHTIDFVADLIMTSVLIFLVAIGRYGPNQRLGIHVDSALYYLLVGIWIPLYGLIYWGPQLIGGRS